MVTTGSPKLVSETDWDQQWNSIFDHYQQDIRHAYYVRALKRPSETRLLEIAAGSFRDMAALCRWGISCDGVDFSGESVDRAKRQFPEIAEKIHKMDAFHLDFADAAFDLTYHNGVWVLFDDAQIFALAKEQARISKRRMIATVHNAHNVQFRQYFAKMKQTNPLYDIRFFRADEIKSIMSQVCSEVSVVPVGKAKKTGEDRLIRMGFGHPYILGPMFHLVGDRFLEQSERLLCIGEL
jgi:ubiquinone/menaquinone biosynthesis C-methylase UbiE